MDRPHAVNAHGVIVGIRAAASVMEDGGRITCMGSVAAVRVGLPGFAYYAESKAAVTGYSQGVAWDLAPRRITVNVVQVGP
ncbi:SDR family oxidoreductase [Streptomyces sp. NPDC002520]